MPTTLDLTGLDKVQAGFTQLINPNAEDLMARWKLVIEQDNRQGILAGLDKNGVPMIPVTYRPLVYSPHTRLTPTKAQRGGAKANARRGAFLGLGAAAYGNLTSAEYRMLGGPPLAPRGQFSRVVTNLLTDHGRDANGQWYAMGYWDEVLSNAGIPFLHYHFQGSGRLPIRDLTGLRPAGREKALEALRNWARLTIREAFGR